MARQRSPESVPLLSAPMIHFVRVRGYTNVRGCGKYIRDYDFLLWLNAPLKVNPCPLQTGKETVIVDLPRKRW